MDSDREGSRHALGLHRSAGMRLHYKSTKMAAEKKSAWPFGFGSGRGSPDSTLGAVSEPYLALQIDENGGRKEARAIIWAASILHYKSAKVEGEGRAAWACGVGSGSGSPRSRLD